MRPGLIQITKNVIKKDVLIEVITLHLQTKDLDCLIPALKPLTAIGLNQGYLGEIFFKAGLIRESQGHPFVMVCTS